MTDATQPTGYAPVYQMRTLAVRITDDLRARLDVIAQLNDRSVTEEIGMALEGWVETSKSDPAVARACCDGSGRHRTRGANQAQRDHGHLRRLRSELRKDRKLEGTGQAGNGRSLNSGSRLRYRDLTSSLPERLSLSPPLPIIPARCCGAAPKENHLVRRPLAARREVMVEGIRIPIDPSEPLEVCDFANLVPGSGRGMDRTGRHPRPRHHHLRRGRGTAAASTVQLPRLVPVVVPLAPSSSGDVGRQCGHCRHPRSRR